MRLIVVCSLVCATFAFGAAPTAASDRQALIVAAASNSPASNPDGERKLSPEEKMARRFPQPIRVGDLIGLPVLDWRDRTIGYVQQVVRTPAGKVQLIVPYRSWLGWFSHGRVFAWGTRPVAVPLETVAMLGRQVAALDMSREEFDAAPVFTATQAAPIGADDTIRIAITRR
jgi:hypothetical protein